MKKRKTKLNKNGKLFVETFYRMEEFIQTLPPGKKDHFREAFSRLIDHEAAAIVRNFGKTILTEYQLAVLVGFSLSLEGWGRFISTNVYLMAKRGQFDTVSKEIKKFLWKKNGQILDPLQLEQREYEAQLWDTGVYPKERMGVVEEIETHREVLLGNSI